MKMLLDPDWIDLVDELSPEDCRKLLLAIFDYPNRECDVPIWKFIKKQLDKDAVKYHAKCARLLENRQIRWVSEPTTEKSEQIQTEITGNSISK